MKRKQFSYYNSQCVLQHDHSDSIRNTTVVLLNMNIKTVVWFRQFACFVNYSRNIVPLEILRHNPSQMKTNLTNNSDIAMACDKTDDALQQHFY